MKKIFLWAYLMFLITCLVACGNLSETSSTECTHTWNTLNCSLPRQCTICGAFDSTKRTHFYSTYGTCLQQAKCYYCGNLGQYGNHKFRGASCVEKCEYCGKTGANFGKHQFIGGSCVEKRTCYFCGGEGEEFGWHQFTGDCTALQTCSICGCDSTEFGEHQFVGGTCVALQTCSVCGSDGTEYGEHSYSDPTCTKEGVCAYCRDTIPALDHKLISATCTTPISCSRCDYTEGEALGHEGVGTCTRCKRAIPIVGSGYGDAVVSDIHIDDSGVYVLCISHSGRRNFIVHSYDASGDKDYLVNEIGNYDGTVMISGEAPIMLNIQADGAWKYEIIKLEKTNETAFTGKGDYVTNIFTGMSGTRAWRFKHDGDHNFIVRIYTTKGCDHIINEIGIYDAAQVIQIPSDSNAFFEITADGNWEIYPE